MTIKFNYQVIVTIPNLNGSINRGITISMSKTMSVVLIILIIIILISMSIDYKW